MKKVLIVIGVIISFSFILVANSNAEGSGDIGLNQILKSETILLVDIINPSVETITWSGTGSIMVTSPTGISIGTFNSWVGVSLSESGAYRIELSEDQTISGWDIEVNDGGSVLTGRVHSTNWLFDTGSNC